MGSRFYARFGTKICEAYEEAQAEELKARQHPNHLDCALKAAECYRIAAELSRQKADSDEYTDAARQVAQVLEDYYVAQSHKMNGWYAYERRDCDAALSELKHEREHFGAEARKHNLDRIDSATSSDLPLRLD